MKKLTLGLALLGLLTGSGNVLAHDKHYSKYRNQQHNNHRAKVLDIDPVYSYSGRRQGSSYGCSSSSGHRDHTGAIIGGIVGGVIGHEIGHSGHRNRHRNGATAAGVVIGAVVGNQYDRRQSSRRCYTKTRNARQLKGYQMTYEYRGRVHTAFVTRRPPNYFRINELGHYRR